MVALPSSDFLIVSLSPFMSATMSEGNILRETMTFANSDYLLRVLRSRISGTCRDGRSRGISRNARWLFRRIVGMGTLPRLRVAVSCVRTSCRRAFEQCELPSTSVARNRGPGADYMPSHKVTSLSARSQQVDIVHLCSTHRVISHNQENGDR